MTLQTAKAARDPSPTLARLLDAELVFSPSVQGIYSNHLAMALVALDQMGAAPEVLEETFGRPKSTGASEARVDVAELERRRDEVSRLGIPQTVRRRVPELLDGPSSALFHPAIRLAYALDAGHESQAAAGLLDWEQRHLALPIPQPDVGHRRLDDVAADLAAHPAGTWTGDDDPIDVSGRPELAAALDGLALDQITLEDVATFALSVHVAADAFVSLHMVTGARALLRISKLLDPATTSRLASHAALDMVVVYAEAGAPALLADHEMQALRHDAPSTDQIAERAIANHDPHVIKLANVALVEEARTGDPLYRYIAARAVDLLPAVR